MRNHRREDAEPRVQKTVWVIDLLLEVTGAILILVAFALAQFRGLDRHGSLYLVLNLVGAALLAGSAATHRQWGFLLLQSVWATRRVMGSARSRPPRRSALVSPDQIVQIVGAVLILAGFILSQRNLLDADSYLYLSSTWPARRSSPCSRFRVSAGDSCCWKASGRWWRWRA